MFAKPINPIGVSFDTNAHVHEIPAEGDGFKLEYEERQYNRMLPSAKDCPRPTKGTNKAARKAANQLNAVIKAIENGAQPACGFMCDVESDSISSLSCDECLRIAMPPHDVRKDVKAPGAATPARKGKDVWLIDSGSEQDLISKAALRNASKAIRKQAPQPIRLVTANGNITASEIADINVDALCEPAQPYILESSPEVLSLGVKCLDQGYSFHWESGKAPTMVRPDGALIQLKVDGHVPYMDSSCEAEPSLSAVAASKPAPAPVHDEGIDEGDDPDDEVERFVRSRRARPGCRSKYQRAPVCTLSEESLLPHLPTCQDACPICKIERRAGKARDESVWRSHHC